MLKHPIAAEDIDYPRDVFTALLMEGSPYAFYLFQWVDYHNDAYDYRLKMNHDVKLFDGTVIEGCYPNANAWHGKGLRLEDKDVQFIRISKKQFSYEYKDQRPAANKPDATQVDTVKL
jgi:hypothetical protein